MICAKLLRVTRCFGKISVESMATVTETVTETVAANETKNVRIFMVGDVMLGRGVDQMLAHHVDPILYEGYITDARAYLSLAVQANGPLPQNRPIDYVWGDAKKILSEMKPDVKIINLETSVTSGGDPWPNKGIHYRMHPGNVNVIKSARIDCCILANNHTLDWGYVGLKDSLASLTSASIKTVGAGANRNDAERPAVFELNDQSSANRTRRILVFAAGSPTAGVPNIWRATESRAGVHYFEETNGGGGEIKRLAELVKLYKKPRDVVVMSLHWGGNWGFAPEPGQPEFARALIDHASVDIVYGHSSHHVKGVEVYQGKLIMYGCGDFLSDYEGIKGDRTTESYRDDLSFMYFVDVQPDDGRLIGLTMFPMRLKRMRVNRATDEADRQWLFDTMQREIKKFGRAGIEETRDGSFRLVL